MKKFLLLAGREEKRGLEFVNEDANSFTRKKRRTTFLFSLSLFPSRFEISSARKKNFNTIKFEANED